MKKYLFLWLSAIIFCSSIVLSYAPVASAEELKIEVGDPDAIRVALEKVAGKSVVLKLTGGEEIAGVVESVGPTAVRIGQLTGKEFYSAVVLIERVSAIIYRAK